MKYAAIAELMRFVWHSDNFCSVHQRDATITIYAHWVQKIHTLLDEDLEGAYLQLKVRQNANHEVQNGLILHFICSLASQEVFGPEKAATLETFWKERDRERTIVFDQARDPEFKPYVPFPAFFRGRNLCRH